MALQNPHLTILVVVYNESPQTSATVRAVAGLSGVSSAKIIIWDNSSTSQQATFQDYFREKRLDADYLNTPSNMPLSMIYNQVADEATDSDFLLILDQDTALPPDYLETFNTAHRQFRNGKLFVPTIKAAQKLVSPSPYFAGWGRAWQRTRAGPHPTRNMTIINSGLFASLKLFRADGVRYDERLKLYGTDTGFFRNYARREKEFYILPTVIEHDLSFDTADVCDKVSKINQMFSSNKIIYEPDGFWVRTSVAVIEWTVRIRYAFRYRELAFLRPTD